MYDYINIDITLEFNNVSHRFCYRLAQQIALISHSHPSYLRIRSCQNCFYIKSQLQMTFDSDCIANFIRDTFPDTCYNFSSIDRIFPTRIVLLESRRTYTNCMMAFQEEETWLHCRYNNEKRQILLTNKSLFTGKYQFSGLQSSHCAVTVSWDILLVCVL